MKSSLLVLILTAALSGTAIAHGSSSLVSDLASGFSNLGISIGGSGSKGYGALTYNGGSSHSTHSSHATGIYAPVDIYRVDPYYYSSRSYVVPHTTVITPHYGHSHHIVVPDRGGYWRRHKHMDHDQHRSSHKHKHKHRGHH